MILKEKMLSQAVKNEVEYWQFTPLALAKAKEGMDHRAEEEIERIKGGEQLGNVHEQAVRDYQQLSELIAGGMQFLGSCRKLDNARDWKAVDMGSGTGVGATIISQYDQFQKIWAVEFSENFVTDIMPEVFAYFKAKSEKIIRVVGDFNHLELEDGSLDLILDIDSFHHSEDLPTTLQECYRTLRPGGVIMAVDRAWEDHYSQLELDTMLDRELNDKLKKKYNIPEGTSFTRRDFGEHEYTLSQWFKAFSQAGFETLVFSQIHPPHLNSIFLKLPTFKFTIALDTLLYRLGKRRLPVYGFNKTRRLFLAFKK